MNKKKANNIIFIIVVIISLFVLFAINYIINPYLFWGSTDEATQIFVDSTPSANLHIKGSKNKLRETIIIGGSEVPAMYGSGPLEYIFNNIHMQFDVVKFKNYYELLKLYLEFHPETKNVILLINYPSFFIFNKDIPKNKSKKLSLQEIYQLLFSFETTKQSLEILKYNIKHNNFRKKQTSILECNENSFYNPYVFSYYFEDQISLSETTEDIKYLKKIVLLLKKKNINYYVLIPPYSAMALYAIYSDKNAIEEINKMKKILVENFEKIYDAAFINKYTDVDLFNINYLYYYTDHPNWIYGIKIYKILFDKENAEKDIVMVLTKDNIETSIKKQQELYNIYYSKNKDNIKKYLKIPEVVNQSIAPMTPVMTWSKKDLPQDLLNEINYGIYIKKKYVEQQKISQ